MVSSKLTPASPLNTGQGLPPIKRKGDTKERVIPLLRSCERCRRRKQKCDGEQPICSRCKGHSAECVYRKSGRFGKRYPKSKPPAGGNSVLANNISSSAITDAANALSDMSTPIDIVHSSQQQLRLAAATQNIPTSNSSTAFPYNSYCPPPLLPQPQQPPHQQPHQQPPLLPPPPQQPLLHQQHQHHTQQKQHQHQHQQHHHHPVANNHDEIPPQQLSATTPIVLQFTGLSPTSINSSSPDSLILKTPASANLTGLPIVNIDGFPLSSATGINILKLDDDVENSIVPVSVTNTLSDGLSVSPNGSAFVNPMYILRTRDLPDLTQGLADSTLRYMYRLLGFTNDKNWLVDQNGEGIQANEKLLKHGYKQQHHLMPSLDSLPPNLDLLDPRNAAGSCITNSFGIPDHRFGSSLAPDPLDSQTPASTPTAQPLSSSSSSITKNIPQALIDVAQRHSINENPQMLYIMLKTSFIDSETAIRATQFWTTLEAGNVSDFVVLAHLAKAAREAHLKQDIEFLDPQNPLDFVCFEAAKREWYSGKATNSTGAVLALHLLSEYGFQSGRYAIMWEFAQYGVETARKISFRGAKYPWKGTRSCECDFELDNLLMCFWLAWGRLFTAAQCLTKRMQFMDSKDLPEYPMHPCQYYANVSARRGITKPDSVEFLVGPCTAVEHSCIPAIWQCYYIVAHMHNYYIDLLEHKASAQLYFQTLGSWDEDLHDWCRTWPESWTLRMQELFESARQINDEKFNGNVPLDADFCHLSKTRNATTSEHKRKKRSVDFVGLRSPENVTTGFDFTHTSHMPSPALVDLGSLTDLKLAETSPYDKKKITLSDKEDYWLVVLYTMYEMARLRAHRIALVFLYKDQFMPLHDGDPSMHVFTAPSLPSVPEGYKYVSDDPMKDAIRYYHSRFECLDAARTLQNLFTMTDLIGFPVSRIGIWVIFSLEHLISIQCGRMASNDWDTKIDAIRRLARLLRQLLTLTKWTSSLYVFTSVVKTYVDNNNSKNIFRGGEYEAMENSKYSECSPWPQDHILSILMRLMKMDAKRFCAYTLPVVFASMCTSDASATLPPDMRMSIAALIS